MPVWLPKTFAAMAAIVVLATTCSAFWGERIVLNQGFGFEAFTVYKPITQRFPQFLAERRIDPYSIQRILPFGLAYYTLRALGLPVAGRHIIRFFEVYEALVLLAIVGVWLAIADGEHVSVAGQWLGFLGLIVNFAAIKLNFYYPVSYDMTALLVGTGALLMYRRGSTAGLLAVSLAGLAVWPTTILLHPLLLLFPARTQVVLREGKSVGLNGWLVRLAIAGLLCLFLDVYLVRQLRPHGVAPAILPLLPLSFIAVAAYVWLALDPLVGRIDAWSRECLRTFLLGETAIRVAAVALLAIAHLVLTRVVASDAPPRMAPSQWLANLAFGATTRPLQFLVAHATYFGPLMLVMYLMWPAVCRRIQSLGLGATILCAFGVLQSVNCETRQLTNLWPFFVLPVVQAVDEERMPAGFYYWMAGFSVLLSKCWLPINYGLGPVGESFPRAPRFQFPAQMWFMNFGPWMSTLMLIVQGIVVGVMALWLYRRYLRGVAGSALALSRGTPRASGL